MGKQRHRKYKYIFIFVKNFVLNINRKPISKGIIFGLFINRKGSTVPEKTTLNITPTQEQITKLLRNIGSSVGCPEITNLIHRIGLDRKAVQRLLGRSREVIPALASGRILGEILETLALPDDFSLEECHSTFGYFSGYRAPFTLKENLEDMQKELAILRKTFPEFKHSIFDDFYYGQIQHGGIVLPWGAERWTLLPDWRKLANKYGMALKKALEGIEKAYGSNGFHNYCDANTNVETLMDRLNLFGGTACSLEKLARMQNNADILIVPVQLGLRHRGRSVRRAHASMSPCEFGLGSVEASFILLTHPERLQNKNDLWINCTGDMNQVNTFQVNSFRFHAGSLYRLNAHLGAREASSDFGPITAFLPQH